MKTSMYSRVCFANLVFVCTAFRDRDERTRQGMFIF